MSSVTNAERGPGDAGHLRRLNLERVLSAVMDRPGTFTRAELIQATGLSSPTVGSLVSHLIRAGVIRDLGAGPSRGGRRPAFLEFNARHGFVAGIDLGPTRTRLAVADLRGQQLAHRIIPTPSGVGPEALLSRIASSVRTLMREAQVPAEKLLAAGAGAPGAVDVDRGVVAIASNLPGWSQVPMRDILSRALGAPVVVENDVNLAVLGERWQGAARGHDTCVFVSVGTGIGAGILVDGALHRGHHFLAGEIGLMCMEPRYADAEPEPRGGLETLAGLKALRTRWQGEAPGDTARWVPQLLEAAGAGDRRAREAVKETARLIGVAVANLSLVVDPSLIVLGGALIEQAESLVDEVRKIVRRIVPVPLEIVVSTLHEEAPLWGSLLVAAREARRQVHVRSREARLAG